MSRLSKSAKFGQEGQLIKIDDSSPRLTVIRFPGGSLELSRTSDGNTYWAHIQIYGKKHLGIADDVFEGEYVDARMDASEFTQDVPELWDIIKDNSIAHIATRIQVKK